ncbi:hypothetical protein AB0H88_36515 [Nonomuraea sp. NPDC050680]|uniref:hypothetical protein n=1 Tax=Nonomuraea sp. NPDC050680 TaxID=3154630 RepID=UPI0033E07F14
MLIEVIFGIPAAFACGAIIFAAKSAPRGRHGHMSVRPLIWGAAVASVGMTALALIAWSTREDTHYDDFGSAMSVLAGIYSGSLLIFGLGPFVPWLLGILGRNSARLPRVFRPAVRHVGHTSGRTATGMAATMVAVAVATALMVIIPAMTSHGRANYYPNAQPGALVVAGFSAEQAATVRTAIQQELPGSVPIVENVRVDGPGSFLVTTSDRTSQWPGAYIGDQTLLRYLTGNPATPYHEGTAVLVLSDGEEITSAELEYSSSTTDDSSTIKSIPAIIVKAPDPHFGRLFIPREAVLALGFRLEPQEFIIDPSHYRVSVAEQERLDRRLGETAFTELEQGYQAPTEWWYVVAVAILIALAGAPLATRSAASERILLRISGGSAATLRFLVSCRAAVSAACGTAIGATAGCVIGLCLIWPMTASIDWEPTPRAPFETPWPAIVALIAALPVLAAATAVLASPAWLTRLSRALRRGPSAAPEPQEGAPTP